MERSAEHVRAAGMTSQPAEPAVTQDRPARTLYEALGYTALPGVRYLRLLD